MVTGLTRKADRERFIEDLDNALRAHGLHPTLTIREDDTHTSIDIVGTGLSALVHLPHRRRGEVPLVHWYDASRPLRIVPDAWSSVNSFHRRKATSFPLRLDGVIHCLVVGLAAAQDGSAFQREDDR